MKFQERQLITNYKLNIKYNLKIKLQKKKSSIFYQKIKYFIKILILGLIRTLIIIIYLGYANDNIYNGYLGILIYLAAHYKISNNKNILKLLILKLTKSLKKIYLKNNKSGILDGVGSYVCFLILISNILKKITIINTYQIY